MRWAGHVACLGEVINAYVISVGKPLGRRRHRWEDNIKIDLKEMRCEVTGGIQLANSMVHDDECPVFIKAGVFTDQLSDWQFVKKDSAPLRSLVSATVQT
jgi:hypothetical protein